jgi:hypothetical protein
MWIDEEDPAYEGHSRSDTECRRRLLFPAYGRISAGIATLWEETRPAGWPSCAGEQLRDVSGLPLPWRMSRVGFRFKVSLNEEYVELDVEYDGRRISLGSRAHHYLLLTLARLRQADREEGTPEASCGWADVEGLRLAPDGEGNRVDIYVHRARRQLIKAGLEHGYDVIERRPGAGQLRLGVAGIAIERQ